MQNSVESTISEEIALGCFARTYGDPYIGRRGANEVGTTSSDRTRACFRQRAAQHMAHACQHLHVARTERTLRHACKREQTESKRAGTEGQQRSSKKGKSAKDEGKKIARGSGKN